MSAPKKPKPTFRVVLKGTGIYPEMIPARMLGKIITAVQSLANGGKDPIASAIRLLDIRRGSASYAVVSDNPESNLTNLVLAGKAVKEPEGDSIEYYMLPAFRRLSQIASSLDCQVELHLPDKESSWTFGSDDYRRIRGSAIVEDEVTVAGELLRVGGATETKCSIRPNGSDKILYCKVEVPALNAPLGKHLYKQVVLIGKGVLFARTWELLRMNVYSATFPKTEGSFYTFRNELRAIAGNGWDVENIAAELEQLR